MFNEPDVQAALSGYDTVYIDGDSVDAEALMARFGAFVFPTVIALAPGGTEVGRFAGSAKEDEFIRFLQDSSAGRVPMLVLRRLAAGKKLNELDWVALSALPVSDAGTMEYDEDNGTEKLKRLREQFANAATAMQRVTPPLPSLVAHRIRVKSLLLDAVAKHADADRAAHENALRAVLADPTALADNTDDLAYHAKEILDFLQPEDSPSRRSLAGGFIAMMEAERSRHPSNAPLQIRMMTQQLPLLEEAGSDVSAIYKTFGERTEALLRETGQPADKAALVPDAAYLLTSIGKEFRAEAVTREALKQAPDVSYLHNSLAYYAYLRGDFDEMVEHAEAMFRGSTGSPGALRWGAQWIDSCIERDPDDVRSLEQATAAVLDHAMTAESPFLGFNVKAMNKITTSLGRWVMTASSGVSKKSSLRAQLERVCLHVAEDRAQAKACAGAIGLFDAPPAEEAEGDAQK